MILKKEFEGFEIDFEPFMRQRNVMVNATQMAKVFGKQVVAFMRNEDSQEFISECLKSENSHFLGVEKETDLYMSKQKSGTWMHRVLALKFAAWLNPKFELWVYLTIEEILFGFAKKQQESISKTVELQNRVKELEEKPDKTGEDFEEYLNCLNELKGEKNKRSGITRQRFSETWNLFNQPVASN